MAITDLKGTTWKIPAGWGATSGLGIFYVSFTRPGVSKPYNKIAIGYSSTNMGATAAREDMIAVSDSQYANQGFRAIENIFSLELTFTGGTDATNADLISWLYDEGFLMVTGTDVIATYNGEQILGIAANNSATIECAGSFMYDDITVTFDVDGNIVYNGKETQIKAGQTATIKCSGKLMVDNIYINATEIPTAGGATAIISNGSKLIIETAPVSRGGENTIIIGG